MKSQPFFFAKAAPSISITTLFRGFSIILSNTAISTLASLSCSITRPKEPFAFGLGYCQTGDPAADAAALCAKIRENFPFFKTNRYTRLTDGANVDASFMLCGGAELDDPFWKSLPNDVRCVMALRHTAKDGIKVTGSASITLDYEGAIPQIDGYTEELVASNTWIFRNGKEYLSYAAGQATSRRAIVMPERGVFSCQNAVSEIYVEQNRSLFSYNTEALSKQIAKEIPQHMKRFRLGSCLLLAIMPFIIILLISILFKYKSACCICI